VEVLRQARTVALEPDDRTVTTWAARTPEGTEQPGAAWGFGLGLGLGLVLGGVDFRVDRVVVDGFGLGAVVVVVEVVVVGVVVETVARGVGAVASGWLEQAASAATADRQTAADTAYPRGW